MASPLGHDLASLDEVEGAPGDVQDFGNGGLGDFLAQWHPDVLFLAVELGFSGSGADRIVGAIRSGVRRGDAAYAAMT